MDSVIIPYMSRRTLTAYARVASVAAKEAGTLLARRVGRSLTVQTKRSPIDLVTEIDRAAEQLIHRILYRAYPTFGFLGEEHGQRRHQDEFRWIVDPLDGTNNFVHGLPLFGVSIGLEYRGTMMVGVIYDPIRRELFVAMKGHGATLNGTPIHVSKTRVLAQSLLSTGFSSNFLRRPGPYLKWFEAFQRASHGVRRIGSTVFCLSSIAAGRLDGFYEQDLWPWDIAAGILLVEEAGGHVSDFTGAPPQLAGGRVVASNGSIHREMLRILRRTRRRRPTPASR